MRITMRHQKSIFILLALPATVLSVSLADFKPRVYNLPSNCQTVYTQTIDGCSPTDFTASMCSAGCVHALQALVADVKSACGNEDVTGTNVIAAFLNNAGPQGLCTNANAVLRSQSTSTSLAVSAKSSSPSAAATSTGQTSRTSSEVSTTTTTGSIETATSLTGTTSAPSSTIALDTSSSPVATPTHAASHSSSKGNSGGGSPFDTEGNVNSAGAALEVTMAAVLLAVSFTVVGALR
ncbi:hypothetical protein DOTSEDRAFT_69356 [Dothistroma septosporum NZE10]|uniref:Extracellular membrane protein CFEM domain-containing protein n=1 Tax=Dothistroma septosporum (strain NZE10 / CBS 128990) TaxID=675120 RepID=N1PYA8_DOTSN|nr:hypothetical protein DOTSEDRAFT_69356 [Dothistroma septosporum NZE10]